MNHPIKNPVSPRKTQFGEAQTASLNVLIDLLIPASRDRCMPAATDLLLYADISDLPAQDRQLFESGLAQIEARSMQQHHIGFAQLQAVDAQALVDTFRAEGSQFIQSFITQTVGRYLAHDDVMPLIGLEARPPWPKGNPVAGGDWSLLDVVKTRQKLYREV